MLTQEDTLHRSLLVVAASSKNKDYFEAVLAAVERKLTPDQVGRFEIWLETIKQAFGSASKPSVSPWR